MKHRNSQKRQYQENKTYFITFDVYKRRKFFKEKFFCDLFIEELKVVKGLKQFKLHAFCINYEHVHFLLTPNDEYNISKIIKSFKENFSRDANKIITGNFSSESDTSTCRFQMRKTLQALNNDFIKKYPTHNFPKSHWQSSYRDHVIRDKRDYDYHFHYTIYNYLKHDLPKDWQYISLNYSGMVDLAIIW